MSEFDIGFVPHGWVRGERLRIQPAGDHSVGLVERDPAELFARGPSKGPVDGNTVHQVKFYTRNQGEVAAWVKWWHTP